MSKQLIDWDFEAINTSQFRCTLFMPKISNRMLVHVFKESKKKLKKNNINLKDSNPDVIRSFEVNKRFFPLMKTILKKQINNIYLSVKSDRIKVLNDSIDNVSFVRMENSDDWKVKIVINGDYIEF